MKLNRAIYLSPRRKRLAVHRPRLEPVHDFGDLLYLYRLNKAEKERLRINPDESGCIVVLN